MSTEQKILDLWERELKLRARLEEASEIKNELKGLFGGFNSGAATLFRTKMQSREQELLRQLQSAVANRERLEESEEYEE